MTGGPYHLLLISALSISGYLLTYFLVKMGILTKLLHRQIWNSILMLSFFISGILGILLVIQLNYQLEWPFMKPLMVWHVDAGIVLCLVATFHFLWHSSYYGKMILKKSISGNNHRIEEDLSSGPVDWPILTFLTGFFATVVQVLIIRELTTVFQGNELMMGWTLGIWMLLTGAGTWIGGRSVHRGHIRQKIVPLVILLSYLPLLMVIGLDSGKNLLFPAGELVNPVWFIVITICILAPLCVLTGYAYALLIMRSGSGDKSFIRVYALESIGSVAGGIIVSFILIRWISVLQSLLLASLVIHLTIVRIHRTTPVLLSSLVILIMFLLFLIFPADLKIKSFLFPNQNLVVSKETAFGNISVCENSGEYTFFENGSHLFTTGDAVINEEYIHYAMLQHPHPQDILLISGGVAGMTEEILKYPTVRRVSLVELNPDILRISEPFRPLPADSRLVVFKGDGRRFIQRTTDFYDVAVIAVPDPSSLQINRYFTTEFFSLLKKKLTGNGIILFGLSPSGNYLSPEKTTIEAVLYQTLKAYFRNIVIIPGEKDYFVASDGPLSEEVGKLSAEKKIPATYVNPEYLDNSVLAERSRAIMEKIKPGYPLNTDQRPLPVFYHSLQFISIYFQRNYLFISILLILLLLPLFLLNPVSGSMYVTGLSASSAEILLIFWFQTFFGNVYSAVGFIFAIFMGGLALGSLAGNRLKTTVKYHTAGQLLFALFMLLLPLLWKSGTGNLSEPGAWLVFVPVLLIPALLAGFQYVTSTLRYHSDRKYAASSIYAADLWGSALGVILITFILVPVFGIPVSCLILAALNGLSAALLFVQKKNNG
jgi:spermidine synthase